MNNIWYKVILSGLLLMLILAPFAGLAPLLFLILVANVYWLFSSITKILIFGETDKSDLTQPEELRDHDTANN
ncbi:hypothetical protein [Pleurocapsa sp. PCC 7319]|uniref:hypothetical protein n=1 Tax=Pleurocapsa sp. PCC 7319 TaxID=118161 RepID=UPI0003454EDB|nr:hypothetical protein [Pleurocapsa sp. PCC 7319]